MKKILTATLLGVLLLCIIPILDYKASMYGNGFFHNYYPLKYDLSVNNFFDIAFDGFEKGQGYLFYDCNYKIKNKYTLHIKEIVGYYVGKKELIIKVEAKTGKKLCLIFDSYKSVYENSPSIVDESECKYLNIIGLGKNMPFIYY